MQIEDMVLTEDGTTYIVGDIRAPFPGGAGIGIPQPGFIASYDGQTRRWVKLLDPGEDGSIDVDGLRVDGNGGITGSGAGEVEGVPFPAGETEFSVNLDQAFLENYEPNPDIEAILEAPAPPLEDFMVGRSRVYRESNAHVTQRITISENGTGNLRTCSSDASRTDGIYATFNWRIDGNTLIFDYTATATCDFFTSGTWIGSGVPVNDEVVTVEIDSDGLKINGFVHSVDGGSNGSLQSGASCTLF